MADNFYPKNSPSVDDILNEVRLMRQAKTTPAPSPTVQPNPEIKTPDVKPEIKTEPKTDFKPEIKVEPQIEVKPEAKPEINNDRPSAHETKSEPAPKAEPAREKQEDGFVSGDKLKSFLGKAKNRGYVPGSQTAKQQIDELFGKAEADSAVINPFGKRKHNAPHMLTPEEINSSGVAKQENPFFTPVHKTTVQNDFELDLDKLGTKYPEEKKPVKGFNIVNLDNDSESGGFSGKIRIDDEPDIEATQVVDLPKADIEATQVVDLPKADIEATQVVDLPKANIQATQVVDLPKADIEATQEVDLPKADIGPTPVLTIPVDGDKIYSSSARAAVKEEDLPIIDDLPQIEDSADAFDINNIPDALAGGVDLSQPLDDELKKVGQSKLAPKTYTREIKGFALSGEEQENDAGEEIEYEKEDEEIDDYHNIDDADAVRIDLETRSARLSRKLTFSAIIAILLAALTVVPSVGLTLPDAFSPFKSPQTFLIVNAVLTALAVIINISGILRGFFNLFRLKPEIDTAVSVAVIAASIQSVYLFSHQTELAAGKVMVYTAVAVMAMVFNLLGKRCMMSRVTTNFELVATNNIKQSCFVPNDNDAIIIAEDAVIGQPYLCCDRSVINLQGYLNNAFCEDPADNMCQTLSPIGFIASLVAGVLIYFTTSNLTMAITSFAAVAATCVPLTSLLSTNLPLLSASRRLREMGGMLSGYNAVEEFADVDCVAIDAEELFPAGSVDLISLKSFGSASIDAVILDAAAVAISAGGPLSDIFDRIIEGRRKMLPKPQQLKYHDAKGISGVVSGHDVQIGTRELMQEIGIVGLPDIEIERRIIRNGTYPVYLAMDSSLSGMFIVKYNVVNEDMSIQLSRLIYSGVTLLIKTSDPNITPNLVSRLFEVPEEYIKIMPSHSVEKYDAITAASENGSGMLAHDNSVAAFAASIVACKKLRFKVVLATVLQTIGVILGFGAVMFFALTQEFGLIFPHIIMAYQLIVALIVLIFPSIGRS